MFEGIFTAVITPMNENGSLDHELWEAQVRRQVDAGIHGLIIGGTTGESYALSNQERIDQFIRAGKVVKKGTPWLAGVNALTTQSSIELARAARDAGATGLLVAAPPYSVPTQKELADHCIAIDDAAGLPITVYNYPGRTGSDMADEFFEAIKGRKNFVNVKESTGDIKRAVAHLQKYPDVKLCCGAEDLALDFFAWGAKMWICAVSNFDPKRIVDFYDTCVLRGDFTEGRRMALELAPLMTTLEDGGKFIASVKYACSRLGYCKPTVRMPLGPIGAEEAVALDAMLAKLEAAPVRSAA
jgi:4-hydroxy-tetrahydrodipicolinate synthase